MFDPSKLNLDLDDNNKVSKKSTQKEIKVELEKVEQSFWVNKKLEKETIVETLSDINKNFVEEDIIENNIKKEIDIELKKEKQKEKEAIVWDISETIYQNKLDEQNKKEEKIIEKSLIDININSLQNIFDIMLKNDSDIFLFEPRDNDIKIIFRKGKLEKEIKYIKFPIYTQILLKIKSLTKMKVEEVKISQEWNGEIQIKDSKYRIISKTTSSPFWEKIILKMTKLEKKVEKKVKENISIWKLLWFLGIISIIILIIWGAFIGFIVASAKTPEDVQFFIWLWINPNEINSFISTVVTFVFATLVFIETIFLSMYSFKAMLTKKIYKSKKIAYIIFSIVLLLLTLSTATAWMSIHKKISNLPNWQMLSQWNVLIYDNSKVISGNFSKEETLIKNTKSLIGPVILKFDLSWWEYEQKSKWFDIEKYIWSFGWEEESSKTIPTFIKEFNSVGTYDVLVSISWINSKWKKETKIIENIPSVEITSIVDIVEKIDNLWTKTVKFNANSLKKYWEIEWFFIEKGKKGNIKPIHVGYEFYPGVSITEDIMVWIGIKRDWKEVKKIEKIFIIKKQQKSSIKWEINFLQNPLEDLRYTLFVKNPDTAFGDWFVETFIWKIWDKIIKKESWINNPEESSKIIFDFEKHWKQLVIVELKDSSWKIKLLKTIIDIPKRLKLKNYVSIYDTWELFEDFKYDKINNEYIIDELAIPTTLKIDARKVKTDNNHYILNKVEWDLDDDWSIDKVLKILELPIDVEWNKIISAKYTFTHRILKDDIINITERFYINSIKKDAILKLKIEPKSRYVPTFVKFDASLTKIKWKNIEKFIFDYGNWSPLDVRGSINSWHKYSLPWEYDVKLTVVTTDGSKYHLVKKLVLLPKPQEIDIEISMSEALVNQEIDFSSQNSQGQIISYFWDFGDGEVSTEANPSHSFEIAWKYDVKLRIVFQNNNSLESQVEINIKDF